jgi:hypothetical protein
VSILREMHVNEANEGSDIEHIWQTTWRIGFYRGGPVFMSALSGIDIALWDLKGMSRSRITELVLTCSSSETRSTRLSIAWWKSEG